MKNKYALYKCNVCGSAMESIGPFRNLSCCGQEMSLLNLNAADNIDDTHTPVATPYKQMLLVQIGKKPHPMTQEHHICWVSVMQAQWTQCVLLDPKDTPRADFFVDTLEDATVYAYCNKHGLWVSDIGHETQELAQPAGFAESSMPA